MMTREVCKECGRSNPLGFHVPDYIWEAVVGDMGTVRCIMCFAQAADRMGIQWDLEIEFYPVSLVTSQRSNRAPEGPLQRPNQRGFRLGPRRLLP